MKITPKECAKKVVPWFPLIPMKKVPLRAGGDTYAAAVDAGLAKDPPGRPSSLAISIVWVAGGAALLLLSGKLGRWLGRGLD
jgi:hypothetical protein